MKVFEEIVDNIRAIGLKKPSLQALQHQADEAMYQAKKGGRNRVSTLQVAA